MPRLGEALLAQEARVAEAAGSAVGLGLVARPRQREIHAELVGAGDDLGLGERDQRRVDAEAARALDARLGGEIGQPLEGLDELGPAIGIAGLVERVHADEDVLGAQRLGPGERVAEKDGVARGHVGDRNAGADGLVAPALGHRDVVGQRRAADGAEIEPQREVRDGAERGRDLLAPIPARGRGAGRSRRRARSTRTPLRARRRASSPSRARRRGGRPRAPASDAPPGAPEQHVQPGREGEAVALAGLDDPGRALEEILATDGFRLEEDAGARQGEALGQPRAPRSTSRVARDHELPPGVPGEEARGWRRGSGGALRPRPSPQA